jgi:hypothetical protein
MLAGKDLAGRALDQRGKAFVGEPAVLDAKALGLPVELRPVGEASGFRVEDPKQAARRTVVYVYPRLGGHQAALVSPVHLTPISG